MSDDEPDAMFQRRFDQWLQLTGLNRVELATLVDRAAGRFEPGMEKGNLAKAVVLWLYGPTTGRAVPPLLLDVIDEYVETVSQEASRGMRYATQLRQATDALILSAADALRTTPLTAQLPVPEPFVRLTDRERQILFLIGSALPNRQIAATLGISEKTVKNHITSLFAKLRVSGRTEALVVALREGVLAAEALTPTLSVQWTTVPAHAGSHPVRRFRSVRPGPTSHGRLDRGPTKLVP